MDIVNTYTPAVIEFTVKTESEEIPNVLGKFKNQKEVQKFFNENNFIVVNSKVTATRLMDDVEKNDIRSLYIYELEEEEPTLQKRLLEAEAAFSKAKDELAVAKEMVSASTNKVKAYRNEIVAGTTQMELDQAKTFELAFRNQYLYYTFIHGELVLCKISNIPEYEQNGLLNSSESNVDAITNLLKQKENKKSV